MSTDEAQPTSWTELVDRRAARRERAAERARRGAARQSGRRPPTRAGRALRYLAGVALVVAVAGLVTWGVQRWLDRDWVQVPTSLAGLPRSDDPDLAGFVEVQRSHRDTDPKYSGAHETLTAYGTSADWVLSWITPAGHAFADQDLVNFSGDPAYTWTGVTQMGASTCVTGTSNEDASGTTFCYRAGNSFSVLTQGGWTADMATAARATDQAYEAQGQ